MKVQFFLRFHTVYGQSLSISGNTGEIGNDDLSNALLMTYLNDEFWVATIELKEKKIGQLRYKYLLKTIMGRSYLNLEMIAKRVLRKNGISELQFIDTWNHAGEFENAFFTAPFQKTLLDGATPGGKTKDPKHITHIFKVKAPLLQKNEVLCLTGTQKP